jgi:hypothetical protein
VAGLGSLGRRRFAAIGQLDGGFVAREVKELIPPATVWVQDTGSRKILYTRVLTTAVRCADPFMVYRAGWVGRRLSPSNSRIELADISGRSDIERVLHSMGFETANIHVGRKNRRRLQAALRRRKASEFVSANRALQRAVERDWALWRDRMSSPRAR